MGFSLCAALSGVVVVVAEWVWGVGECLGWHGSRMYYQEHLAEYYRDRRLSDEYVSFIAQSCLPDRISIRKSR